MRLLVDTNIFLEVILGQAKHEEARALLTRTGEHDMFISDYSLHSIGLLLFQRKRHGTFREFLRDMMERAGLGLVGLLPQDMERTIENAERFHLDFDDAYQYALAEKHGLALVSFDTDFDRTERGRKTPVQVLPESP